ncbi:MAG: type II toxin-antitoxin system HicB family antitoxin [Synechococcaceae cyanobacterium SM2_3_60]|nr:type II toxin-antitoxin system HicB family antitoxin [Synechococcaceae cyanobacterium SM2_3_60]
MKTQTKTLEDYLALPYAITLYPDAEGGYTVVIADLPGCLSQGETEAEALANINDAKAVWLETALANGDFIPVPSHQ